MVATTINRPKQAVYKNFAKLGRLKKQRKKKNYALRKAAIPDAEIMPAGILRKRRTNPWANITLSGKKKRKILNQIRRTQSEKSRMQVEAAPSSSRKQIARKGRMKEKSVDGGQNSNELETEDAVSGADVEMSDV